MREILFRGKQLHQCVNMNDGYKWIYGYLVKSNDKSETYILPYSEVCDEYDCIGCSGNFWEREVISETVGQYTGLKDKNDNKIFEGDILKFKRKIIEKTLVEYSGSSFICKVKISETTNTAHYTLRHFTEKYNCEVIGNIHDNPELLED